MLRRWAGEGLKRRRPKTWVRVVSVLLTLVIVLGAVALLLGFLISDVASNINQLIDNFSGYVAVVQEWMQSMEGSFTLPPELLNWLNSLYEQAVQSADKMGAGGISEVVSALSGGVLGVFSFLGNLVLGIVIAAYMMGMKETLAAQAKKIVCAVFELIMWTGSWPQPTMPIRCSAALSAAISSCRCSSASSASLPCGSWACPMRRCWPCCWA